MNIEVNVTDNHRKVSEKVTERVTEKMIEKAIHVLFTQSDISL